MSPIPQLLQDCLGSAKISVEGASLSGNILTDSRGRRYFAKTGYGAAAAAQMRGEARGLVAMARTAPGLAPEFIVSCSTSKSDSKEQCAMLSQYFDLGRGGDQRELARRIAQMHTPLSKLQSKGDQEPLGYGFPVPTHCGATEQDNTWEQSWEDFFRDRRLGDLVRRIDEPQITKEWEELQKKCVPHPARMYLLLIFVRAVPLLLRDFSPAPEPVILHGDLWSGNKGFDTITGQNVIFDPACYYGHNEADLGIMHMFGGRSRSVHSHQRIEPDLDQDFPRCSSTSIIKSTLDQSHTTRRDKSCTSCIII